MRRENIHIVLIIAIVALVGLVVTRPPNSGMALSRMESLPSSYAPPQEQPEGNCGGLDTACRSDDDCGLDGNCINGCCIITDDWGTGCFISCGDGSSCAAVNCDNGATCTCSGRDPLGDDDPNPAVQAWCGCN